MRFRSIGLPLWSVAAAFLATVIGVAFAIVARSHADTMGQANARVTQAAASADASINRTFIAVDALLAGIPELVLPEPRGAAPFEGGRAQHLLGGMVRRNLLVRDLAVMTTDGIVLATAMESSRRVGLTLPPEFLRQLNEQTTPSLVVSVPTQNFGTSENVMYFGRRAGDLHGRPLMVVAEVPTQIITGVLASGMSFERMVLTLERDDGQLFASVPTAILPVEKRMTQPLRGGFADGVARVASGRTDGTPSIVAARGTLYQGIIVAASLPLEGALAAWRQERGNVTVIAMLIVGMIILTAAATHMYLRHLGRARQEIAQSRDWLNQALASMRDGWLLCDADDKVVAWNQRYVECFPWLREVVAAGLPYESLVRSSVAHVLPEATPSDQEAWVLQRIALHRRGQAEFEHQVSEGLVVHVTEAATPAGGIISVFRDVTRAERDLSEARSALQAAQLSSASAIHELVDAISKPINAIMGALALIAHGPLSVNQRQHLDMAKKMGDGLLNELSARRAGHADEDRSHDGQGSGARAGMPASRSVGDV